ncbi:hypothetical protein JX265_003387 [Neoarthrinium moseri]|uniref:DUF7580 domain-containing protein n=1 Tax=Neoarthrinium moseri TaxID=1658444 RepID=A0A9P9WSD9_9PEZI|nr:hypothetical protein JX265_003387 [Neoarthrinium moseri]
MSGFEIAGVVLGAIPLAISALEHYESTLDRLKAFKHYGDRLEVARTELLMERTWYEMSLRIVLTDVVSVSVLEEMMASPASPHWQSPNLKADLITKLGAAYSIYMVLVQKIEQQTKQLEEALKLDQQKSVFQIRSRVKYTLKRSTVKLLLAGLADCNQRLERFIGQVERVNQSDSSLSIKKLKPTMEVSLREIQEHAEQLHRVLSRAWVRCAHRAHSTNLLLEHRMLRHRKARQRKLRRDQDETTKFTVCFDDPQVGTWRAAQVKVLAKPQPSSQELDNGKVRFSLPPPSDGSVIRGLTLEQSLADLQIVEDLCQMLHTVADGKWGYELCLDLHGKLLKYHRTAEESIKPAGTQVSLHELLSSSAAPKRRYWSEEDRRILAVTLASSYLQLHQTPWIGELWSDNDIIFTEIQGKPDHIDVRHPFITKTHYTTAPEPESQASTIYTVAQPTHDPRLRDNINLLALAKLLLTIRLNSCIDDLLQEDDLGPAAKPNEATDIRILQRWMIEEQGNLSFQLKDAVSYCMKTFAVPGADLRSPDARQEVLENVVAPLVEELFVWQEGL